MMWLPFITLDSAFKFLLFVLFSGIDDIISVNQIDKDDFWNECIAYERHIYAIPGDIQ